MVADPHTGDSSLEIRIAHACEITVAGLLKFPFTKAATLDPDTRNPSFAPFPARTLPLANDSSINLRQPLVATLT
jgi:hypothetical protein